MMILLRHLIYLIVASTMLLCSACGGNEVTEVTVIEGDVFDSTRIDYYSRTVSDDIDAAYIYFYDDEYIESGGLAGKALQILIYYNAIDGEGMKSGMYPIVYDPAVGKCLRGFGTGGSIYCSDREVMNFESGYVQVARMENVYMVKADVVLEGGTHYKFAYEGAMPLHNMSPPIIDNIIIDEEDDAVLLNRGDVFQRGRNNISVQVTTERGELEVVLEVPFEANDYTNEYQMGHWDESADWTMLPGYMLEKEIFGSHFIYKDGEGMLLIDRGMVTVKDDYITFYLQGTHYDKMGESEGVVKIYGTANYVVER